MKTDTTTPTYKCYKWKLVCRDGQRDENGHFDGHSFWRDEISGRISLCDMSGDRPHLTDDGVLWLDPARDWSVYENDTKLYVDIPLLNENGDRSKSFTYIKEALRVAPKLGVKLVVEPGCWLAEALPQLANIEVATFDPANVSDEDYIRYAREEHAEDGKIEIDDDAEVTRVCCGAYVQAWVFVSNDG